MPCNEPPRRGGRFCYLKNNRESAVLSRVDYYHGLVDLFGPCTGWQQRKKTMGGRLLFVTLYDMERTPYAECILPSLAAAGWDITVVGPNARRSALRDAVPYLCRAIDLPARRLARELKIRTLLLSGRIGPYDLICVHSQELGCRAWPPLIGSRKLVYYTMDYYDPLRHPLHTWLEKKTARQARLNINAEFHRGYIYRAQYRLRSPLLVVAPALPAAWPTVFKPGLSGQGASRSPAAFTLALHGTYSQLRMVDELLDALKLLPARFQLLMGTGGSSHGVLQQRLEELELGDRVRFLKSTKFSDMVRETGDCDAGVLLYRNTDLGNFFQAPGRLTEYLVNGLPVLASCHTGLEQLVTRFGIGECVDSRKPERIAAGLLRLEARVRSGELTRHHCREVFLAHFAVDNRAAAIVDAFEAARSQRHGRVPPEPPDPWWWD